MRTTRKAFPLKDLIIMTSSGTIDLVASKSALKSLAADPEFDRHYEIARRSYLLFRAQILVIDWLINHTSKLDRHFGKFLHMQGKSSNEPVAP